LLSTVTADDAVLGTAGTGAGVTLNAAVLGLRKGLIEIATVEGALVAPKGIGAAAGEAVVALTDVKLEAILLTETVGCVDAGADWDT
jgi:hypothetical protein